MKYYIRTFGCQMNESDSEHISGILASAGAEAADSAETADLVIANTCAVRAKSEEKLYSFLGRMAKIKKKKPLRIGVVGCVAQLHGDKLFQKRPYLDFIVGPHNYEHLGPLLLAGFKDQIVSTSWSREWKEHPDPMIIRESPISAYVPIMEGCNNFCAYCIVPFTRGREKHRPLASILEEVRSLAERGYKEIQFLGQNVNTWNDRAAGAGFADLLSEAGHIDGPVWLRFITSHPKNFTLDIAETMAKTPRVCRQLHLPLQSGSTSVLRRMKRGYTGEEYLEKIRWVRNLMPEIALSTDIIVGFPGETDAEFRETLDVLGEVRFANIFSFRYSPRPMTEAARLEDDVPFEVKRDRLAEVQRLQKQVQNDEHRSRLGRTMRVLALGRSKKDADVYSGRNEGFEVVNFPSAVNPTGLFVDVRISAYGPYSLSGERI